jgi:hypothetical protein
MKNGTYRVAIKISESIEPRRMKAINLMKSLLLVAALFGLQTMCDPDADIDNQFNWLDAEVVSKGGYSAYGTLQSKFTYGVVTNKTILSASLFVDPVRHVIALKSDNDANGKHWVTDSGYYLLVPNGGGGFICFYDSYDYTRYVQDYKQALNNVRKREYSGLVRDPGACDTYASVSIGTDSKSRVEYYTIHQLLYDPGLGLVIKYYAAIQFDDRTSGQPALSDVSLPAECTAVPAASLRPYCLYSSNEERIAYWQVSIQI